MNTTNDWQLPSGSEVESATWHPPVQEGFRGRLDTWKSRGLSKVHDVQRNVQRVVADRRAVMQTGAKTQATRVQDSMRTSPMKWAGIAAASGLALGLAGRIAQARNKRKHEMPTLVIVEASC
jgi:hypothetical protein